MSDETGKKGGSSVVMIVVGVVGGLVLLTGVGCFVTIVALSTLGTNLSSAFDEVAREVEREEQEERARQAEAEAEASLLGEDPAGVDTDQAVDPDPE